MTYTAKKVGNNYEVYQNGQKVSTGSASVLGSYGLSTDNLLGTGGNTPLVPQSTTPPSTTVSANSVADTPQIQPPIGVTSNPSASIMDSTSVFKTTTTTPTDTKNELTQNVVNKGAAAEADLNKQKGVGQTIWDKITSFMTNRPSESNLLEQGKAQYGVQQNYDQIQTLLPEVNNLREQLATLEKENSDATASIDNQGRGIPLGILTLQKDRIDKVYAARKSAVSAELGAKAATMSALQGNISQAQSLIKQAVDAKLYDYDQKIKDYQDLYNNNKDIINNLDSDMKNALNIQYQELRDKATKERDDSNYVGNLMVDYPSAGISFTDDRATANKKAAAYSASHPKETSGSKLTVDERKSNAIAKYSSTFIPGAKLSNGIPVLDVEGFMTPEAWKTAIKDAPSQGLTREDFIKQFGHLIWNDNLTNVSPKYGLTIPEQNLITGK